MGDKDHAALVLRFFEGKSFEDIGTALGGLMGNGTSFSWLLQHACDKTESWLILPPNIPDERYDYLAISPPDSAGAMQREINRKFGVVVKRELRETNVLIFRVVKAGAHGIKPPTGSEPREKVSDDTFTFVDQPLEILHVFLENFFKTPVLDETGLTGNHDYALQWDKQWWFNNRKNPEGLRQVISNQLGLELVPMRRPIEMLVVKKMK